MCCWVNPSDKGIQIIFLAIGIKYYHELRESSTFKWSSCPAPELSRSWMDNSEGNRTPQGDKGGYFQYLWHHKLINLEGLCKGKSCCFCALISDHWWSIVGSIPSTYHFQHLLFVCQSSRLDPGMLGCMQVPWPSRNAGLCWAKDEALLVSYCKSPGEPIGPEPPSPKSG